MSNTNLTIDMITQRALMILHNNVIFSKNVNRQYNGEFAKVGAKIGSTLRIRKPTRWGVSSGPALSVQDATEEYTTLTIDSQKHVDFQFNSNELTLSIDEYADRYLKPIGLRLATQVDSDGLAQAYNNVYNMSGTLGASVASVGAFVNAGAKLDDFATPRDGKRNCILTPSQVASAIAAFPTYFNPSEKISKQYNEGVFPGGILGYNIISGTQNVKIATTGSRTTGTGGTYVVSSYTAGASTIVLGHTGESGKTWAIGDRFTIATINSVNPESKQDTGSLMQFVVTAAATCGASTVTLTIANPMVATGTTQNVTAIPTNQAVTVLGAASTSYAHSVAYHEDAFTLATADLIHPQGVHMVSQQNYDGLSLRVVAQYDINNDNFPCRTDILYGWKTQRPEMATIIAG